MGMVIEKRHNKKQLEAIRINNSLIPEILFNDGAMGSGKTFVTIELWLSHLRKHNGQNKTFIMTGHTLGSLKRNVLDSMTEIFGINTDLDHEHKFRLFGNTVCCFGTDKADSYKAIRGIMTSYGHYANELTLSHQSSVKECIGRNRGEGARFFWEMNPADPSHPLHRNYIERVQREGNTKQLARISSTIYDNAKENGGFLPVAHIKRMEADFTGIWGRKYLLGEWCALEGQIYFLEQLQYYDDSVINDPRWWNNTVVHGYMDPATGSTKKTGCFTSAFAGAMKGTDIYLTDAVVKKIMPNELTNAIADLIRKRNYSIFAIEDNFSQDGYVVKPLKQAFPFVNIQGQSSREDKLSRLIGMHSVVTSRVYFPERWRHERNSDGWLLLQQLCNITKDREQKKTDSDEMMVDAPDALEGLIRTFKNYSSGTGRSVVGGGDEEAVRQKQIW